uniref:Immunoglobulin domain-containing protein n=1 Tax=Sinocyclocheilus rhinocerous TaxID=307959 RepID=A0A673HT61_9TELE
MTMVWLFKHLFLCCSGVFGVDAVKSVSVTEGDSVTLEYDVTEIQTHGLITWTFGHPKTHIALTNAGIFNTYNEVLDGRFRERLQLDHQTGSLTITNTSTTDSGLYQIIIKGIKPIPNRFSVTVYGESQLSLSVMEGDPVTLHNDLHKRMDDYVIQWMFGYKSIAKICVKDGRITVNDVLNGRFRDRLKLDKQTGSLTITDIRPEHTGVYELQTYCLRKSFILTVQRELTVHFSGFIFYSPQRLNS